LSDYIELDLVQEFDRLVAEGGYGLDMDYYHNYNCEFGNHKWKWYVGFHVERFWYCEICDAKDKTRPAPPIPNLRHK
jgi:hypothetical protein